MLEISQTFVAFSEYMNFIKKAKTFQENEFVYFRMTENSDFVDSRFDLMSTLQFNDLINIWLIGW